MKQITALLVILVSAIVICTLAFIPVRKGLSIYYSHNFVHLTEVLDKKTAYDMIYVGSSRTIYQIYPKIIDSICGMNTYNAGVIGGRIADFELNIKGYLVNHPAPQVVVLNIDLHSFGKQHEIRQSPEYYAFLGNEAVRSVLAKYGYHPYLIRAFNFTAIADLDDYVKETAVRLLRGKGDIELPEYSDDDKGFRAIDAQKPDTLPRRTLPIYDEPVSAFDGLIDFCKQKKIQVILTYAPESNFEVERKTTNADSILSIVTNIAKKNQVPFFRDDSLAICQDHTLFWNESHLNKHGAMVYSAILAQEIKAFLAQKNAAKH